MQPTSTQEFLFQRIREMLPPNSNFADIVSEILHISTDSAYRRIRGETPLVLDEARLLCRHFHISADQLLDVRPDSVMFRNIRIHNDDYSYDNYLQALVNQVKHISSFEKKEIIYLTKDIPLFHNFYFKPLIDFRYFFWMKSILQHPSFINRGFEPGCVPPATAALSVEFLTGYTRIPSVEIWNTECINSTISQIEFCKDSGLFSAAADIRVIYDALEETIFHLKIQAEAGVKFMPGKQPETGAGYFQFFYNRVILGDNTILVTTDDRQSVFLNYDVLNYITTHDTAFCNQCGNDLRNLMRKATLISQTGEKQRNIFFNILTTKVQDRKKNL